MVDLSQFTHFHFLRPWWFLALIPLSWSLWHLWRARNPVGRWKKAIAPHLLKAMLIRHGRTHWLNPVNTAAVVAVIGIIALAGPTWKQQSSPFSEDVTPLVIMLDASPSMQQGDIQPSRLERAKQKIHDLLALRPSGRVGLIAYAGTAHSVIPLTNDPDVVDIFLNAIDSNIMPRRGKAPELALPFAENMLRDADVPGAILMIGDGVGPNTYRRFRQYCSEHPHQLQILGMGREYADVAAGGDAFIPLEQTALQKLADTCNGNYQAQTPDKTDVQRINRHIHQHLLVVEDGSRPWVDAGYGLLFPFALMLLFWFRKGWTLHWLWLLLIAGMLATPAPAMAGDDAAADQWHPLEAFMNLWLTPDQQGWYYMHRGEYRTAAEHFENIAWRGVAYYRAENFRAAIEMFSRLDTPQGYFNLGNAYAHSRQYLLAVKSYDRVLQMDPQHAGALKNRAKIQTIIDDINRLSASQQAEESEASKELGQDDPHTAEGAERKHFGPRKLEQWTAEDVLLNEDMNALWMRQVQKNPSRFLAAKFQLQLQQGEPDAP